MNKDHLYTRKEISKILSKASDIQKQKDLYGDKDGLSEQELLELAQEVGIEHDVLLEAIDSLNDPILDQKFNWLSATSKIQNISIIKGEIDDTIWNNIVAEIRKETGGIGKTKVLKNIFEWEQRKKDVGFKHISLTALSGSTKLQIVSSWTGLKVLAHFISMMTAFVLTASFVDNTSWSDFALFIAPLGALIGLIPARLYLKHHFKKQKRQIENIVSRIRKTLLPTRQPQIKIETDEIYSNQSHSSTNKTSISN